MCSAVVPPAVHPARARELRFSVATRAQEKATGSVFCQRRASTPITLPIGVVRSYQSLQALGVFLASDAIRGFNSRPKRGVLRSIYSFAIIRAPSACVGGRFRFRCRKRTQIRML
jgi:hypothetical protein